MTDKVKGFGSRKRRWGRRGLFRLVSVVYVPVLLWVLSATATTTTVLLWWLVSIVDNKSSKYSNNSKIRLRSSTTLSAEPIMTTTTNDRGETRSSSTTNTNITPTSTPTTTPNNAQNAKSTGSGGATVIGTNRPPTTITTTTTGTFVATTTTVRILAMVFPQFHRDEINDRLWGDNFTDWDSLRAAPLYNRLGDRIMRPIRNSTSTSAETPVDDSYYYDYTDRAPRRWHGELARQYGLDGFVFHHYWFYDPDRPGRPNLHAPLEALLRDGEPNLPFALHWCNSKWTSTWNGPKLQSNFRFIEPGVLQKQYYPKDVNDTAIVVHYQWLRRFFHHPQYIKVHGKPLLMLYVRKPGSFVVLQTLRRLAIEDGFPGLYITVGLTKNHPHLLPLDNNSDAINKKLNPVHRPMQINGPTRANFDRVLAYPNPAAWNTNRTMTVPRECHGQSLHKMERLMEIPGIITSFDNTPRRNQTEATIWSRPDRAVEQFYASLAAALYYESCCLVTTTNRYVATADSTTYLDYDTGDDDDDGDTDRFIVINAMNEWAEGMALEPSDLYGRRFLEAIRDVKQRQAEQQCNGSDLMSTTMVGQAAIDE